MSPKAIKPGKGQFDLFSQPEGVVQPEPIQKNITEIAPAVPERSYLNAEISQVLGGAAIQAEMAIPSHESKKNNSEIRQEAFFNKWLRPLVVAIDKKARTERAAVLVESKKREEAHEGFAEKYHSTVRESVDKFQKKYEKQYGSRPSSELMIQKGDNVKAKLAKDALAHSKAAQEVPELRQAWTDTYWAHLRANIDVSDINEGRKKPLTVDEVIDSAYWVVDASRIESLERGMYGPRKDADGNYIDHPDRMREVSSTEAASNRRTILEKLTEHEQKQRESQEPPMFRSAQPAFSDSIRKAITIAPEEADGSALSLNIGKAMRNLGPKRPVIDLDSTSAVRRPVSMSKQKPGNGWGPNANIRRMRPDS